jgi:hypothetical protein
MALPELSLTSWLDGVFDYFAKESGIAVEDLSSKWGAETLGVAIEGISDMILTPLSTKILGAIVGGGSWITAIWGKSVVPSKRLRDELYVLGNHLISRLIDPTPTDIIQLRQNLDKLVAGLKLGNSGSLIDAFLRSPDELRQMIAATTGVALSIPTQAQAVQPPTTPVTPATTPQPAIRVYA